MDTRHRPEHILLVDAQLSVNLQLMGDTLIERLEARAGMEFALVDPG